MDREGLEAVTFFLGFSGGSECKEFACNVGGCVPSLSWEDPLERAWQPNPVFFFFLKQALASFIKEKLYLIYFSPVCSGMLLIISESPGSMIASVHTP